MVLANNKEPYKREKFIEANQHIIDALRDALMEHRKIRFKLTNPGDLTRQEIIRLCDENDAQIRACTSRFSAALHTAKPDTGKHEAEYHAIYNEIVRSADVEKQIMR